ncbi:hypothetical protein KJ910_02540 [Patescibacteria group bacterium]|nr:hypothetical protein [Patescibacteria group bacterium]MBU1906894.1 hypothetical protein [Patescibacteria group bacterium]
MSSDDNAARNTALLQVTTPVTEEQRGNSPERLQHHPLGSTRSWHPSMSARIPALRAQVAYLESLSPQQRMESFKDWLNILTDHGRLTAPLIQVIYLRLNNGIANLTSIVKMRRHHSCRAIPGIDDLLYNYDLDSLRADLAHLEFFKDAIPAS